MQTVLLCCLSFVVGAHAAISTTGWPTTGNCSLTDPTTPCDQIITAWTDDTNKTALKKIHEKLYSMSESLVNGSKAVSDVKPDLCTVSTYYRNCLNKAKTDCSSRQSTTDAAVNAKTKYISLVGKYVEFICKSNAIENTLKFNYASCYTGSNAASVKRQTQTDVVDHLKKLASNQKPSCKTAGRTLDDILGALPSSFSKQCKQKMRKLSEFLVQLFVRPDKLCKTSDFKERKNSDYKKLMKGRRVTAQFISCNHHRVFNNLGTYITCGDETKPRKVTLFAMKFIEVLCEMHPAKDNGKDYTECRAMYLIIKDSDGNPAIEERISADSIFDRSRMDRTIGKKSKSKKSKKSKSELLGDVKFQVTKANKLVLILDKGSHSLIMVRKGSYTPPGKTKKYILSITVRASEEIFKLADGRLAAACEVTKDINTATSGRRRKRSTAVTAAKVGLYDSSVTGDPASSSFITDSASDYTAAASTDNEFNAADRGLVSLPLFLLTLLVSILSV